MTASRHVYGAGTVPTIYPIATFIIGLFMRPSFVYRYESIPAQGSNSHPFFIPMQLQFVINIRVSR